MSEFGVLGVAASGMDAQRFALDVAARNVAAAQVADPSHPFTRLVPLFAGASDDADGGVTAFGGSVPDDVSASDEISASDDDEASVTADGVVRAVGTRSLPGVDADAVTEMVAVLNAQRAYEANASVFDAGKRLAERTIEMGRS